MARILQYPLPLELCFNNFLSQTKYGGFFKHKFPLVKVFKKNTLFCQTSTCFSWNCQSERSNHSKSASSVNICRFSTSSHNMKICVVKFSTLKKNKTQLKKSVPELAQTILEATRKVDVMADTVSMIAVEDLVKQLRGQGFNNTTIMSMLAGQMKFLNHSSSIPQLTELLLSHGLPHILVSKIMQKIPNDIEMALHHLLLQFSEWLLHMRAMGFNEKQICSTLTAEPLVIFIDKDRCQRAYSRLTSLFSAGDVKKIICKTPSVLNEKWRNIHDKFDYAYFKMGYTQTQILQSSLFMHSLEHIQDRHIFLTRTGIFLPVSKKHDPALNANPSLQTVVDTTDAQFMKKLTGLDVEEYRAFKLIREVEREQNSFLFNEDNDSDNDDFDSANEMSFPPSLTHKKKLLQRKKTKRKV